MKEHRLREAAVTARPSKPAALESQGGRRPPCDVRNLPTKSIRFGLSVRSPADRPVRPRHSPGPAASRHRLRGGMRAALDPSQLFAVELFGHRIAGCRPSPSSRPCRPWPHGASGDAAVWRPSARPAATQRRLPAPRPRASGHRGHRRLRPGRRRDRKGRSDRNAIQQMLHASILCVAVRDWTIRCKGSLTRAWPVRASGQKQLSWLLRSRENATLGVTYPTSPAADNMTGFAFIQARSAFLAGAINVFRELRRRGAACCWRGAIDRVAGGGRRARCADDRHHPVPLDAEPEHRCDGGEKLRARHDDAAVHRLRRRLEAGLPAVHDAAVDRERARRSGRPARTARRASTLPIRSAPTRNGATACR